MSELDPTFAKEISKYGATHFNACYNCGNCTAVCNLSEEHANFPRMFIRYGLLGEKEKILNSKEIWLCYSCGDCSESCPRQAHPGEYMAALRKYTIAGAEKTGLARLIFTNNPWAILISLILAVILGTVILTVRPDEPIARWLFIYLPYEVIHNLGLGIFALAGLTSGIGIYFMIRSLMKKDSSNPGSHKKPFSFPVFIAVLKKVSLELAAMKRYRDCDAEEDSHWKHKIWLVKPWFVHWSIMWGFIGLLAATIMDFIFKDPATIMWLPSRFLGTLTGILLLYGTTLSVYYHLVKPTKTYADTKLADWSFLLFLWIAGFTGFWLEIAVMSGWNNLATQVVFLIHTVISMELVLLFAFSKFAHAFYRPLALYFYYLRQEVQN